MGELKDKTRILVTHAIDFLHVADQIIVMKKGHVVLDGTFESLKDNAYLVKILKIHNHNKESSQPKTKLQDADHSESENEVKNIKKTKKEGKIISEEDEEEITVKTKIFKRYFSIYFGGCKYFIFACIATIFIFTAQLGNSYVLGLWTQDKSQKDS